MDMMLEFLSSLEAWHWIAFGLVLIGIEIAIGTFDLLFIGLAALATALFKVLAPAGYTGWEWQLGVFTIASLVLIILGRTVFAGMRRANNDKPHLNQRTVAMIGKRGVVTTSFEAGSGRIRIGDTEWSAETADGHDLLKGVTVVVEAAELTVLKVRKA
ncbi:MAG: NfeD family protein [Pseudomonadota bacterium]